MAQSTGIRATRKETPFRLREALEAAGMSQRRLARVTGIDTASISRLACGHIAPTWATAVAIADAAGISLDLLRDQKPPLTLGPQEEPQPKKRRRKKEPAK
jgi:transcriptional regulator with XRE-family HTH domain